MIIFWSMFVFLCMFLCLLSLNPLPSSKETWYWDSSNVTEMVLSGVKCTGSEMSLQQCQQHKTVSCQKAAAKFAAGVICSESECQHEFIPYSYLQGKWLVSGCFVRERQVKQTQLWDISTDQLQVKSCDPDSIGWWLLLRLMRLMRFCSAESATTGQWWGRGRWWGDITAAWKQHENCEQLMFESMALCNDSKDNMWGMMVYGLKLQTLSM